MLYWQAFGGKLGPILGPAPRALKHLRRVMQLDQCFGAVFGADLVGIVGFQGNRGGFAGGTAQEFRDSFGRIRAMWGLPILGLVGGPSASEDALMIDGFSVAPNARGGGVGAALLAALADHARTAGYSRLELDVTGSNFRARNFYTRHGFYLHKRRSIGPLRLLFGFGDVLRMSRDLSR